MMCLRCDGLMVCELFEDFGCRTHPDIDGRAWSSVIVGGSNGGSTHGPKAEGLP
jgi:hypothetical protein